jgi:adenylate cyclase
MNKLIIPLLVILSLPLVFQSMPTEILKLKIFDAFVTIPEPSGNFVILNITEEDVEREGGYPLPRRRLAQIQVDLINKGAIGVGWVISFPQPDRMGGDEVFATTLSYAPSVLATFEDGNQNYPKTTGTVIKGPDVGGLVSTGVKQNYYLYNDIAQGVAIAPTEVDQLVRRIPLLLKTPDGWAPSFGTHVLKSLTGARTYIITTNDNGVQEIAVRGIPPVKTDSLGRKWISWVDTPQTTLSDMSVEGKFVFVGVTANGVMPQIATPVGLLEPHKIQAALAESILIQDSPYIPDYALALELLICIASLGLVWAFISYLGITWGITLALLTMGLTGLYGLYTIGTGVLIDVTWSLISQFITGAIAFYLRFREQWRLREQVKKQFEHYLDPRQVKKLQSNPELLKLGGEKRYATYLFTDVRGFTSLSESVEPEQVTYIMNKALTAQQKAVQKHEGMVDKYIGDAMMAIFNAPMDLPDHEDKAIRCALDIQKNMQELNKELISEGLPSVAIGIGINSGQAVIGNMGSESRFDYTAIGDAVNTAARLESSTKEVGEDLIIGHNTKQSCNFRLKLLKPIKVKGKTKALTIYTYEKD